MTDDKKELEDSILEEFEWALQDPNSEKIRQLGEVVSIITTKLMEAIDELQTIVNGLQTKVNSLDSKMESLASRVSSGATIAAGASPAAGAAVAGGPIAGFDKPAAAPPPAAGGGMSMMGELKQLLAARRSKADTT